MREAIQLKKNFFPGILFLLPSLIGVSIFVLVPFLDVIRRSFCSAITSQFVGIENYKTVFDNTAFRQAAGNSLRFTAVCIPLLLVLSLLLALVIWHFKGKFLQLKNIYLIPMAIPVASIVVLWKYLFHEEGLLNAILAFFQGNATGLTGTDWMNTKVSFWVLVFTYIWKNIGYDMILWLAGLASIPKSMYEAAEVDGAGEWMSFWFITFPNLLPSFFTIMVLSLLNSFKVFREAYLVSGDYPEEHMYLLQHLFQNWFRNLSLDKLSAAAVLVFFFIFVLILIMKRFMRIQ